MKKIFFSVLFIAFFISVQVTFGDTIGDTSIFDVTVTPDIPIIKGKVSNQPIEIEIAHFDYASSLIVRGDITEASISGQWGSKNINKILKLDLYLDDTLLIDFQEYYSGLSKSEQKALKKSLKQGGMIYFNIPITDLEALEALMDGEASLYLVGKPKFFSNLSLGDITLQITDPPTDGNGTPVPEPATMLLLGSGLIGIWGLRKKIKK